MDGYPGLTVPVEYMGVSRMLSAATDPAPRGTAPQFPSSDRACFIWRESVRCALGGDRKSSDLCMRTEIALQPGRYGRGS